MRVDVQQTEGIRPGSMAPRPMWVASLVGENPTEVSLLRRCALLDVVSWESKEDAAQKALRDASAQAAAWSLEFRQLEQALAALHAAGAS